MYVCVHVCVRACVRSCVCEHTYICMHPTPSLLPLISNPTPFTLTLTVSPTLSPLSYTPLSLSLPTALPLTASEKSLRKYCEDYGSVLALRIFPEKGYAFIKYESHEIAARAIYSLNGQTYHGQVIKVKSADKNWIDSEHSQSNNEQE